MKCIHFELIPCLFAFPRLDSTWNISGWIRDTLPTPVHTDVARKWLSGRMTAMGTRARSVTHSDSKAGLQDSTNRARHHHHWAFQDERLCPFRLKCTATKQPGGACHSTCRSAQYRLTVCTGDTCKSAQYRLTVCTGDTCSVLGLCKQVEGGGGG